jgi:ATP-dependent Zn protease
VLTLLLVVLGLALLYAYRSQTPTIQTVTITQAIQEVNGGQVKKVTIFAGANRAVLELANADKQQTNLPERDEVFQKALFDYNTANPSRQITIDYQQESPTFSVIGSILLSLLPVFLIGGFFYYMMRQSQRR